jgi:hypothetical protein
MQIFLYLLAAVLGFLGLVFVVGSQGEIMRIVVGIVLWLATGALVYFARVRLPAAGTTTVVQKIDVSGNVNLEPLKCKSCGGTLSEKSITVQAGAIFVHCEFCGTTYQIEEAPKW